MFLESPYQVDMKSVVKPSKHFFGYFNTQETQCVAFIEQGQFVNDDFELWNLLFVFLVSHTLKSRQIAACQVYFEIFMKVAKECLYVIGSFDSFL